MAAMHQQQQQQPSLWDDDFEVIESAPPASISPYEMSLLMQPPASASAADLPDAPRPLAEQMARASRACASLHEGLAGNNNSLAGLLSALTQQQKQLTTRLEGFEATRQELTSLRNRRDEWRQTTDDYMALKNQYSLLANTKERLEAERAELLIQLRASKAPPSEPVSVTSSVAVREPEKTEEAPCDFEERLRLALEAERSTWQAEMQLELEKKQYHTIERAESVDADRLEQEQQMRQRVCELEEQLLGRLSQLEEATSTNQNMRLELGQTGEQCRLSESKAEQLAQRIAQLEGEVLMEQTKFSDAEQRHSDHLDQLRQNSQVRQLEELRRDLEQRQRRETELSQLYGESDQTVNDIIRAAEEDKRLMQEEIASLKCQLAALEAGLVENGRRLEASTGREMELGEKLEELRGLRMREEREHEMAARQAQDDLRNAEQRHHMELKSARNSGQLVETKLRTTEQQLEAAKREIDRLKGSEAELTKLCAEGDLTVRDILATSETDKRVVQGQLDELSNRLDREAELRSQTESALRQRSSELADACASVANLQHHSEGLQSARQGLEHQLRDCRTKCSEATDLADQMRTRLQAEGARACDLEARLNDLKVEHTKVRANYNDMEHSLPELLKREHDALTRASQAEENMDVFRSSMERCRQDFEHERYEKEKAQRELSRVLQNYSRLGP